MNSKKALKLLIIIHIFSLLPGCVSSTGRLGKPRYWIVKDGKPAAVVVIPQNASPVELFAAQELVHYVKESTGARLPMLTKAPARATSIIIGGPHRQTSATVLISRSSFRDLLPKPDAFLIRTRENKVLLAGGQGRDAREERGTLYAVYAFLEEVLGCIFTGIGRFGEDIPHHKNVALPSINRVELPDMDIRGFVLQFEVDQPRTLLLLDWMAKNRMNSILLRGQHVRPFLEKFGEEVAKRGIQIEAGHHSFYFWVPPEGNEYWPEPYFKTHPEYYSLIDGKRTYGFSVKKAGVIRYIDGQLCLTNPDLVPLIADHMIDFLNRYPSVKILDLWPQDQSRLRVWCECPNCTAIIPKDAKSETPLYLTFLNAVAELLSRSHPNCLVSGIAYQMTGSPPREFTLHPNIIMTLAPYRCYAHDLADPDSRLNRRYFSNLTGWCRIARGVQLYEYYMGVFGNRHRIHPLFRSFQGDFPLYKRLGVKGFHTQGGAYNFWTYQFNFYAAAQMAWDTSLKLEDVLHRFCVANFGEEAAPFMENFYRLQAERLSALPEYRPDGLPGDAFYKWFNAETREKCRQFLDKAKELAKGHAAERLRMTEAAFHYSELIALQHELYELAEKSFQEGDVIKALQFLKESDKTLDEIEAHREAYRDQCVFHLDWTVWDVDSRRRRNNELRRKLAETAVH